MTVQKLHDHKEITEKLLTKQVLNSNVFDKTNNRLIVFI